MNNQAERDPHVEAVWRSYLTKGTLPEGMSLPWFESKGVRKFARLLPSDPRCKMCHYPFRGAGGALVRSLIRLEPSKMNPHLCNVCERFAADNPGGAEVNASMLFADIRGSTPLAAKMDTYEFGRLISRFYQVTTNVIYEYGGMVEKLVGDEITAFFVPAFTEDNNFARAAIKAGQDILAATGHGKEDEPWVPVGVGIHTGKAYIGAVGEPGGTVDIAVLGDNVNIASRLTGQAKAGELVASSDTYRQSGLDTTGLEVRSLLLKGKEDPVEGWIYRARTL